MQGETPYVHATSGSVQAHWPGWQWAAGRFRSLPATFCRCIIGRNDALTYPLIRFLSCSQMSQRHRTAQRQFVGTGRRRRAVETLAGAVAVSHPHVTNHRTLSSGKHHLAHLSASSVPLSSASVPLTANRSNSGLVSFIEAEEFHYGRGRI